MTGKEVFHYAVAVALVLATVPLYRYIIERGRAADTPIVQSPQPAVAAHAAAPAPVAAEHPPFPLLPGGEGRVVCWRGLMFRQTSGRWGVPITDGKIPQCEIRSEPVRPQSSGATG